LTFSINNRISAQNLYFFTLSVLSFTFLRKYLILLLPFLFVLAFVSLKLRITQNSIILLLLLTVNTFFSGLIDEFYPLNYLVSFCLVILSVLFLFSKPKPDAQQNKAFVTFIRISANVLLIVNLTALINLVYNVVSHIGIIEDSFTGIYGISGLAMHTLSTVNFLYAIYFYFAGSKLKTVVFVSAGLLCFFGLGLLTFLFSILVYTLINSNLKKIITNTVALLTLLFLVGIAINIINPRAASYIKFNIASIIKGADTIDYDREMQLAKGYGFTQTPRKLTFHLGFVKRLFTTPHIILFGTGPGTYNSRTSFLLNGDYSRISFVRENSNIRPRFAVTDVYPLWNSQISYQFNDGTRNEPFSTIVAFLVEYGVIFTTLIALLFYLKVKKLSRLSQHRNFLVLSFIFFVISLAGDNYWEYPEVSWIYITMIKCMEIDTFK